MQVAENMNFSYLDSIATIVYRINLAKLPQDKKLAAEWAWGMWKGLPRPSTIYWLKVNNQGLTLSERYVSSRQGQEGWRSARCESLISEPPTSFVISKIVPRLPTGSLQLEVPHDMIMGWNRSSPTSIFSFLQPSWSVQYRSSFYTYGLNFLLNLLKYSCRSRNVGKRTQSLERQ